MMDRATFNNIEHMGLQFVIYTLLPWIKRHEGAMMRDLLLPSERSDLYIEFNVSGLLRGDQKSRYEAYAIGRNWGWLSANDVRRLENMPPIAGGDRYLAPLNMAEPGNSAKALNATPDQMKEIEDILCRV
jgi:HK97 family phage portal protein